MKKYKVRKDANPYNLTDKQLKFCQEYLIDLNATQAAIRAGYSEATAKEIGSENLTKPNIQKHISESQAKLSKKTDITIERVINEFAKVAFFDVRKVYDNEGQLLPIQDIDSDSAAAIAGIESYEENKQVGEETFTSGTVRKIKFADKLRALENLGKHLGMYEKDNGQKQPVINMEALSAEQLNKVLEAQKAING